MNYQTRKRQGWTLNALLLNKRVQSEKATFCMIPIIWRCRKDKTIEKGKRSMVAKGSGAGRKWWGGGTKEDFVAHSACFCNDRYMTWCICQMQRTVKHKVNPNVNDELQLIKMYRDWFSSCSKYMTLMQEVNNWETVRVG